MLRSSSTPTSLPTATPPRKVTRGSPATPLNWFMTFCVQVESEHGGNWFCAARANTLHASQDRYGGPAMPLNWLMLVWGTDQIGAAAARARKVPLGRNGPMGLTTRRCCTALGRARARWRHRELELGPIWVARRHTRARPPSPAGKQRSCCPCPCLGPQQSHHQALTPHLPHPQHPGLRHATRPRTTAPHPRPAPHACSRDTMRVAPTALHSPHGSTPGPRPKQPCPDLHKHASGAQACVLWQLQAHTAPPHTHTQAHLGVLVVGGHPGAHQAEGGWEPVLTRVRGGRGGRCTGQAGRGALCAHGAWGWAVRCRAASVQRVQHSIAPLYRNGAPDYPCTR